MRILWLCNIMLPAIAETLGLPYSNREGWLTGIYEKICMENRNVGSGAGDGIELGICFPVTGSIRGEYGRNGSFRLEESNTVCYAFNENLAAPELYDASMETRFQWILKDFMPDMVHIFGTEFPHTLAMVRAFARPERILMGIQGLCYACAEAYTADLPERVVNRRTFRDWLRKDSIRQQQEKFRIRGEREKEALLGTANITGRTDFDRIETERINGKAKYYFMNETMRTPFYSDNWEREKSVPHSIFLSQGDYPIKGFHYVLKAMPKILQTYPDACIYVAGNSVIKNGTLKDKIKLSSYGKYLLELIKDITFMGETGEYQPGNIIKVLGKLSAEEMKMQFLKSSLFLCPSAIENSPNSVGEAMLLGVPVVAARTGGIPSMISDGVEGLLYEAGNVNELANAVMQVWKEPEEALHRAEAAKRRAFEAHDGNRNYEQLLSIYREICK